MLHKRTILFSDKYGWAKDICSALNLWRYKPCFNSFSNVDLSAFDILMPQHLSDIIFVREQCPQWQGIKCYVPPMKAIDTCNDKLAFNHFMVDCGYAALIPDVSDTLPFPYILKKRIDEFGVHSRIITSRDEEQLFQKFLTSDQYFKQAYMSGQEEWTTHILMVDGKIVFDRTLRFSFGQQIFVKGAGCKPRTSKKFLDTPHIDVFAAILNHMGFEGLCCFNYKTDHDQLKIFEINPRYGGSMTRFLPEMMKAYTSRLAGI